MEKQCIILIFSSLILNVNGFDKVITVKTKLDKIDGFYYTTDDLNVEYSHKLKPNDYIIAKCKDDSKGYIVFKGLIKDMEEFCSDPNILAIKLMTRIGVSKIYDSTNHKVEVNERLDHLSDLCVRSDTIDLKGAELFICLSHHQNEYYITPKINDFSKKTYKNKLVFYKRTTDDYISCVKLDKDDEDQRVRSFFEKMYETRLSEGVRKTKEFVDPVVKSTIDLAEKSIATAKKVAKPLGMIGKSSWNFVRSNPGLCMKTVTTLGSTAMLIKAGAPIVSSLLTILPEATSILNDVTEMMAKDDGDSLRQLIG